MQLLHTSRWQFQLFTDWKLPEWNLHNLACWLHNREIGVPPPPTNSTPTTRWPLQHNIAWQKHNVRHCETNFLSENLTHSVWINFYMTKPSKLNCEAGTYKTPSVPHRRCASTDGLLLQNLEAHSGKFPLFSDQSGKAHVRSCGQITCPCRKHVKCALYPILLFA